MGTKYDPGAMGDDTIDDVTSMRIGFSLYHQFGKFADKLSVENILDALETTTDNQLPHSRDSHWCWNRKRVGHI